MTKTNFADKLIDKVRETGTPCIVGLDPRIDLMPTFVTRRLKGVDRGRAMTTAIVDFHKIIIDQAAEMVPAVKLQIAFFEQYGGPGMAAFAQTIRHAKKRGLLVIVDAKRNDIGSTVEAYANALLGRSEFMGQRFPVYDVDCITVSPYLGGDSLLPFVNACAEYGKGLFVLVKTSNPGSKDIQDQRISESGLSVFEIVAQMVEGLGRGLIGKYGYSSIGAVVGATFPQEARNIRDIIPRSIFLVPGYGAQGGTAKDVAYCFNKDGLGAVVNASRSITYSYKNRSITIKAFRRHVVTQLEDMIRDIKQATENRARSSQ